MSCNFPTCESKFFIQKTIFRAVARIRAKPELGFGYANRGKGSHVVTEAKLQEVWEQFEEEQEWEAERPHSSGRKNTVGLKRGSFNR